MHAIDAYAREVVSGRLPAGKYHRLAAVRHERDRDREGTRRFPYWCNVARADRFVRFAQQLRHYKGEWAGRSIELQPHQVFRLGSLFAWTHRDTGLRRYRVSYNEIPRKNGKALALDTPVPTPTGWAMHGDLRVGDAVFGPDGHPRRVEWTGPIEHGPCFRLTVSTGESFVAHAHHEWITQRTWFTGRAKGPHRQSGLPPVETQRIAATLRHGSGRHDYVHRIPVAAPLDLPSACLPIPPYTLGAWLGDGTTDNGSLTVADPEIVARIEAEGVPCRVVSQKGKASLYRLDGRQGSQQSFTSRLRRVGVLHAKHIPMVYLRASYAQRLEVLRGLVDTDGYLGARGEYEVVSCSPRLAGDLRELIHSLGLKSTLRVDRAQVRGRDCGPRYRLLFSGHEDQVATLVRKQTSWATTRQRRSRGRTITACDPCASVPTSCIQVEGGEYLVGHDFVTTHNSLEAAIVALYLSFFDGEAGSEAYCVATKRDQARIVFRDCQKLVQSSGLRSRIRVLTANLHRDDTASKLEPLGADKDSTDGLNPHVVILDEAHAMKDRGMIDVMETATGARRHPLIFWITTAGSDLVSPCGDQHHYACQILDRVITDDTFFGFIAHADPEDDWTAERTWRKANPNYGVSVKPDDLRGLVAKAIHMPSAAAAVKQKRLNLWVNALAPWLSLEGWRRGQRTWTAESMRGEVCWVGVDLSSKIDLTAVVLLFPPTETRASWRVLCHALTPADTLVERARRDRAPYEVWVTRGWLQTNPGNRIDQDRVRAIISTAAAQYQVQGVGIDPWNAGNLITDLEADGLLVVEVPQNRAQLSETAKQFEADVLDGLVDSGGNELLAWCISNVVAPADDHGNIYPSKRRSRGRIDPVMAALNARKLASIEIAVAADPELITA